MSVPSKWKLVWPQLLVDKVQEPAAVRALIKRNLPDDFERSSPHDLRRTFISRCSEMGLDIVAIEKTVGHQLPGMLRVYNHHDYLEEQLVVLQSWGENSVKGKQNKKAIGSIQLPFLQPSWTIID